MSKVILSVAGISATICAFQYFTAKNNKLKRLLKSDFLQNKNDLKKDSKGSNIVNAILLVKPEIDKDKLDKNYFKNSLHDNNFNLSTNKSKSDAAPAVSKKVIDKLTVSYPKFNSNSDKEVSKYDPKSKNNISKIESKFAKSTTKIDSNCEKVILKCDSDNAIATEGGLDKLKDKRVNNICGIIILGNLNGLENLNSTSNERQSKLADKDMKHLEKTTDSICKGSKSESDPGKMKINKESQDQSSDKRVKNHDKNINLEDDTSTSYDKNLEQKSEVDCKKEPNNNKVTQFRIDLNQQHRLFTDVLKLINDEQKEHENNIDQLETHISVATLYKKILDRQNKILSDLNKLNCNDHLILFIRNVFNLQVKVWKKASNCLRYKSKLSDKRNVNLKEAFDHLKLLLVKIEDVLNFNLKRIKLMLLYINETDENEKTYTLNLIKNEKTMMSYFNNILQNTFQESLNQSRSLIEDINRTIDSLKNLFYKFKCICYDIFKKLKDN